MRLSIGYQQEGLYRSRSLTHSLHKICNSHNRPGVPAETAGFTDLTYISPSEEHGCSNHRCNHFSFLSEGLSVFRVFIVKGYCLPDGNSPLYPTPRWTHGLPPTVSVHITTTNLYSISNTRSDTMPSGLKPDLLIKMMATSTITITACPLFKNQSYKLSENTMPNTFDPSNGGIGIILNSARETFIYAAFIVKNNK